MKNYEVKLERFDGLIDKTTKSQETIESKSYNFNQGFVHFYDDNEVMVASYPSSDIISIREKE